MGLLDALLSGGSGGGLLDFLNQQPTSFADRFNAMPVGQNQPSPLDNAQWPAGPNGAPASFADRFNAIPGALQPFEPSGRQFDAATFDPSTYAPNQAQPISIAQGDGSGSYQMPRFGSIQAFTPPDPAAPPQNAQPTQGQLPGPPAAQQPATQPPQQQTLPAFMGGQQGGGFGDRLSAGFQNFANAGGPLQALAGGISGLMSGNRTDPQGMQQQNQAAQFYSLRDALVQNGETQQAASSKAMAAVLNPEAAKTILPELFTSKQKYGVVSEDPFAGKQYGFINEREQTVNGKPINAQSSTPSMTMGDLEAAKASGATGEALYQYLPKQIAPTVKAMIEGRQPLPSTAAMRSPATLALIDAAHAVDPTFDATSWASRLAGQKDFTSGKSSEMVRAANQTMAHVGSLLKAMDNLKNSSFMPYNATANYVSETLGAGEQGAFRTNAHAVAEEMSKVFKGANLSDAEIRHWEQNLSENMSPAQQKAQVAKLSELLHGSLAALEEKRVAAIGPAAAAKAGPILKAESQRVLEQIDKWVKGNGPAQSAAGGIQEGATATNPQTGAKITFRNGKWQ